jgi:tRNA (mo5U34)-methyltransferase
MSHDSLRQERDQSAARQRAEILSGAWWHSIDLGGGQITPGVHKLDELRDNYARFHLPADLAGKRVLDVGCWDGFYSFEAERHGAEVVAVDCWRPENFFAAHRALGSRVEFRELSVYEITRERLGAFDIVFFLGVLYHLRHPLLALERICEVTREVAVIESYITDDLLRTRQPVMEFYELDEMGGQYDNWWGPTGECLLRLVRAAGFARAEALRREPYRLTIKAYRRWDDIELETSPSLRIGEIINAVTLERSFPRRGRRAFLALMVEGLPPEATREQVRVEVGGYGINPIYVGPSGDPQYARYTQVNAPVPPGLDVGAAIVRVTHERRRSDEAELSLSEGSEW